MGFSFSSFFSVSETWVLNWIMELKLDAQNIEAGIKQFWSWLEANAGTITADAGAIAAVVSGLSAAGQPVPAALIGAVQAMDTAVAALNASVAASQKGATTVDTVIAGFTAAKQAQAAHSAVSIALVTAPTA